MKNNFIPNIVQYLMPFWLLFFLLFFVSCSDEEPIGTYRRDLAEVVTDSRGLPSKVILDDGHQYEVTNTDVEPATPDSVYRLLVTHLIATDERHTHLYYTEAVGSSLPFADYEGKLDGQGLSPLKVISVWRLGRYINLRVDILTSGMPHGIGLLWEGFEANGKFYSALALRNQLGDGATLRQMRDKVYADNLCPVTLRMRLLHDIGDNSPNYTRTSYISLPVYPFDNTLVSHSDSIALSIPTAQGFQRFVTLY